MRGAGKMYEDSIQELNNLIGELDEFQREHEMKMKQKERGRDDEPIRSNPLLSNGLTDFCAMTRSAPADNRDFYSNFDKLSICSGDPNPILSSTQSVNSSDLTFSDIGSACNVSHQSNTELNGSSNGNINHSGGHCGDGSNQSNSVQSIQLIQDGHHVPDSYLKEHTEIVVLRRKDSLTDLSSLNGDSRPNGHKKDLERVSSFRCTSFSKPERDSLTFSSRANKSPLTNGSDGNETVINRNDDRGDETLVRSKPHISPRPASLSGLFKHAHNLFKSFYS